MTVAALPILGPLAVAVLILLLRRGAPSLVPTLAPALALAGAGAGLAAALATLVRVSGGAGFGATLPGLPGLPLRLVADPLSALLLVVVAVVSFFVLLYGAGYMLQESGLTRFFAGMSFFAAAMQALVLAGDWILLLAAWELIGLSSYLLIGFWFDRPGVSQAANRAFLYTRTADLGLYFAIFVLITAAGSSEISATLEVGGPASAAAGLLLLLAVAGKSAQAPLSGWLMDAMAGPTPVSALLHSATLVAAGAILLIRTTPLMPQEVLLMVGLLGGATAVISGLVALAQSDLKRLLAASTSSQYGLMLLAVGAGAPVAAAAHLVAHAAIKSALFLSAGVFQHARHSTELARLASVGRDHRRTFLGFAVAGLALAGIPPLSGFFSKEAIVIAAFESPYPYLFVPLALAGTLLTGAYIARAARVLWRRDGERAEAGREPSAAKPGAVLMGVGLAALAGLAVALGGAFGPLGSLLGAELPQFGLAALVGFASLAGLLAAAAGLAAGWRLSDRQLLGPLSAAASSGFRVRGGFDGLLVRPALAVARSAARCDDAIHAGVLAVGRGGRYAARISSAFDTALHGAVIAVGRAGMAVAAATRGLDESGLDGMIANLVRGTRALGGHARELQSGLVHRELLLAVAGGALVFVLLMLGL